MCIRDSFYEYKDHYLLSPSTLTFLTSLTRIPMVSKTIIGVISDTLPIMGLRRKPYLILFSLINSLCWMIMGFIDLPLYFLLFLVLMNRVCFAVYTVIGEAIMIENAQTATINLDVKEKNHTASLLLTIFFGADGIGLIISQYFGGRMVQWFDKSVTFMVSSTFSLSVLSLTILFNERRYGETIHHEANAQSRWLQQCEKLKSAWSFTCNKEILGPLVCVYLLQAIPSMDDALNYFYSNKLRFPPEVMGSLNFYGAIASAAAPFVFNRWFRNTPFKTLFICSNALVGVSSMTLLLLLTRANLILGIPDKMFTFSDSFVMKAVAGFAMTPVLVLLFRMCPKNMEGTMMSLFTSVIWLGFITSGQLGSLITTLFGITQHEFSQIWLAYLVAKSLIVIPLIAILFVKFEKGIAKADEESKGDQEGKAHNLSLIHI
eukprot:TRINITY_DN13159_c0_g1_i1.p1 TRINITY_DN13159_c0_g1~~TRINITY_DN13159_c0_g1_i1.p1  ORF type:complete len:452 (-),score=20.56 TRINITY_DN13159_c0_g1_i1:61-1356(-)